MSGALSDAEAFLDEVYKLVPITTRAKLSQPFVTLTYASSLDGKIAGSHGKQIRLSGDESMLLTHRLRARNDGILVGIGTVLNDDPQLNVRYPIQNSAEYPRPYVLDSQCRTPIDSKFIRVRNINRVTPVILCGQNESCAATELRQAGVVIKRVSSDDRDGLSLTDALRQIASDNIKTLMVEGGASVISSFLASGLVDLVIVTVAPVLVGDGVAFLRDGIQPPAMRHVLSGQFGHDTVIVCQPIDRS